MRTRTFSKIATCLLPTLLLLPITGCGGGDSDAESETSTDGDGAETGAAAGGGAAGGGAAGGGAAGGGAAAGGGGAGGMAMGGGDMAMGGDMGGGGDMAMGGDMGMEGGGDDSMMAGMENMEGMEDMEGGYSGQIPGGGGGGPQKSNRPADLSTWTKEQLLQAVEERDGKVPAAIQASQASAASDREFAQLMTEVLATASGVEAAPATISLPGVPGFPAGVLPGANPGGQKPVPPGGVFLDQPALRRQLYRSTDRALDSMEVMLGEAMLSYAPQAVQGTRGAAGRLQNAANGQMPPPGPPTLGLPSSGPPTSGPPTSGPPTSGPPTSGPPTSGPPTSGPPTSGPPTSDKWIC